MSVFHNDSFVPNYQQTHQIGPCDVLVIVTCSFCCTVIVEWVVVVNYYLVRLVIPLKNG